MEPRNIAVRRAQDADRAAVLALAPRLAEGIAPWRDQGEALAAGRRWLEDSLAAAATGDGAVFVAVSGGGSGGGDGGGGDVLGVISIRPTRHFTGERDGYIGELAVTERASRQGAGRALIAAADGWARGHGLTNLTLHTGAYNASARAFYAALGFTEESVPLTATVAGAGVASHPAAVPGVAALRRPVIVGHRGGSALEARISPSQTGAKYP